MILPVKYSGTPVPGVIPTLSNKGGLTGAADIVLDDFLDLFRAMFNTATQFGLVEMFSVPNPGDDPIFIKAFNTTLVGASASPRISYGQAVFSFRTLEGGRLKVYAMEGTLAVNQSFGPVLPVSVEKTFADYIVSDDNIVLARDTSFPEVLLSLKSKTNDVLRKRAGL
jgi:hypothetical protein